MLPLFTDPELLASLRLAGVDARLAWNADGDTDALVLVEAEPERREPLGNTDGLSPAQDKDANA